MYDSGASEPNEGEHFFLGMLTYSISYLWISLPTPTQRPDITKLYMANNCMVCNTKRCDKQNTLLAYPSCYLHQLVGFNLATMSHCSYNMAYICVLWR
jgi:hypothetical protein